MFHVEHSSILPGSLPGILSPPHDVVPNQRPAARLKRSCWSLISAHKRFKYAPLTHSTGFYFTRSYLIVIPVNSLPSGAFWNISIV